MWRAMIELGMEKLVEGSCVGRRGEERVKGRGRVTKVYQEGLVRGWQWLEAGSGRGTG
jgi:hypothetical protein